MDWSRGDNMIPKVVSIDIVDQYILNIRFSNDVVKLFDVGKLLSDSRFEALKNKALFYNVQVDAGGYGISWNDDIDLSEYELWTKGTPIN